MLQPVQRSQVIGDVRIDDALEIEVCEQNEGAATGRRLRWKLEVGFTNRKRKALRPKRWRTQPRCLGFGCAACSGASDDPIASLRVLSR